MNINDVPLAPLLPALVLSSAIPVISFLGYVALCVLTRTTETAREIGNSIAVGFFILFGVAGVFFLAIGGNPDVEVGEKMLTEHARDTYSVTILDDDVYDVFEALNDGKSSESFLVEGYDRKVYAAVTPRGDVTIRDARTDDELPRR